MKTSLRYVALVAGLSIAALAHAHGGADETGASDRWTWDPWPVAGLAMLGGFYVRGTWRSRRPQPLRLLCFGLGWLTLVAALLSPIHALGGVWFSIHMVQHELLMVIAAPLLALGHPDIAILLALPKNVTRRVVIVLRQIGGGWWSYVSNPLGATLLHATALWLWHLPSWFEAGLRSDFIHALQHASFLGTAVLFWRAMLRGGRRSHAGLAILYLFLTATHSGALGALLTFATRLWYPSYAHAAATGGLSSLDDQQLGGLIMWVPAGLIYAIAALVLAANWLRAAERTVPAINTAKSSPACEPAR